MIEQTAQSEMLNTLFDALTLQFVLFKFLLPVFIVLIVIGTIRVIKINRKNKKKIKQAKKDSKQKDINVDKLVKDMTKKNKKQIHSKDMGSEDEMMNKISSLDEPINKVDYRNLDIEFDSNGKMIKR